MIDYARPFDQTMCEYLPPTPPAPARLDDFQVFKKVSYAYDAYYRPYDGYEPDVEAAGVYHSLVAPREHRPDQWRYRVVAVWTEEDTMAWVIDCAVSHGYNEYDVPVHNFRVPGSELRGMRREEVAQRMAHPRVDPLLSRSIADTVFEVLRVRLGEEMLRPTYRYEEYPNPESQVLDLDTVNHRGQYAPYGASETSFAQADSSDDAEDVFRSSETASPDASDESKSGDEEDKRRVFKRPPGRPKGTGRKVCKRPRSVSVPEFLRNLLFDEKYCPSIIKWEDHSQGKFRFVKPDEVAKLWGQMKQNDNMTFEKFSRAMRYHYRQAVLVSVPTARLVYQFGHKGPDFRTDNPNFKVKLESDHDACNS
ncbi:ETS homologous factor-like [Aricia agestis]|uniref:ETS homologous factor-like n=1 Tax=Aricia agestis TaxID=91739 RepID=UPI001C20BCE3|nr:ETS homologous factor-like [Aricia agestis]